MPATSSRWKIPAVIALSVGSYVAGTYHPRPDGGGSAHGSPSGKESASPGAEGGGIDGPMASKTARGDSTRKAAGPVLGTPFTKGGAREWFFKASEEGWGKDIEGFLSMFQICGTLDEAAALELATELKTMLADFKHPDSDVHNWVKDDDILEGAMIATLFRFTQLNPEAGIDFLMSSEDIKNKDDLFKMAFGNLAKANPGKLVAEIQRLEGNDQRKALEGAAEVLRRKDPDAAVALLEKFPNESMDRLRRDMVEEIAAKDSQEALKIATRFASGGGNTEALSTVVDYWAREDRAAALAWAAAYHGPGELGVKQSLLCRLADEDPRKAVETMADLPGAGSAVEGAAGYVAERYAKLDLEAAKAWVAGLAPSSARDSAEQNLISVWVKSDPLQAAEWIDKMPAGQPRDNSAIRLIEQIKRRYPQEAFDWAGSLRDPEQRNKVEQDVIKDWREQDPDAANAAWVGRHGKQ